ncbi:MAG: hypothetical protein ACFFEO_01445 [Candidatus Thorarchaeota archaeon]
MKKRWIILIILGFSALIITGINSIVMVINASEISGEHDYAIGRMHIAEIALNYGDLLYWDIECQYDLSVTVWDWLSENPMEVFTEKIGVFRAKWSSESYLIHIIVHSEYAVYLKYSFKIIPFVLLIGSNIAIGIICIIVIIITIGNQRKRIMKRRMI